MRLLPALLILFVSNSLIAKSVDFFPVPTNNLVKHTYYTLSYNEKYEQANWLYYILTDSMVLNGGEERSNSFKMDKLVTTGSAKSSDYTKSGYDRGHLCPAADMGFNLVAMQESFLMSNISPQSPDFNRGIWKELESEVRKWAKKERKIIVISGPLFADNKGSIGTEEVLVPGYFFKVIYDTTDEPKLIAFVFPNAKSERPITDFAVTADQVETLAGYDFFSQLPDDLESQLEAHIELAGWFDGYTPTIPLAIQSQVLQNTVEPDLVLYLILVLVIISVVLIVFLKGRKGRN